MGFGAGITGIPTGWRLAADLQSHDCWEVGISQASLPTTRLCKAGQRRNLFLRGATSKTPLGQGFPGHVGPGTSSTIGNSLIQLGDTDKGTPPRANPPSFEALSLQKVPSGVEHPLVP